MASLSEMEAAAILGMEAGKGRRLRYITGVEVEYVTDGAFYVAYFKTSLGRETIQGTARTPEEMTSMVIKAWLED